MVRNGYRIYCEDGDWCVRYNNARFDILRVKKFYTLKDAIEHVDGKVLQK